MCLASQHRGPPKVGTGLAGLYKYASTGSDFGGDVEREPSPRSESALPPECRKYFVAWTSAGGQSSSWRYSLAPITNTLTGLSVENWLRTSLKRKSYQSRITAV